MCKTFLSAGMKDEFVKLFKDEMAWRDIYIFGKFPGDNVDKVKNPGLPSTKSELAGDNSKDIKKLSTELSTYPQVVDDTCIPQGEENGAENKEI